MFTKRFYFRQKPTHSIVTVWAAGALSMAQKPTHLTDPKKFFFVSYTVVIQSPQNFYTLIFLSLSSNAEERVHNIPNHIELTRRYYLQH